MNTYNEPENPVKERHVLVTIWLILMIIGNLLTAIFLLISVFFKNHYPNMPIPWQTIMALLAIANILFALQLFRWKKVGFVGFIGTTIIAFIINLFIGNASIVQLIYGLLGIVILYAVLQIKKHDKSAWKSLE